MFFRVFFYVAVLNCVCGLTKPFVKDTNDNADLLSYVQQLEQKLATAEQTHAAVLSTILSKIAIQEQELSAMKSELNSTLSQLSHVTNQLQEIKAKENASNAAVERLVHNISASARKDVGFEAHSSVPHSLQRGSIPMMLTAVTHNIGQGYNPATGIFTAPMSGTYLVWFNIAFSSTQSVSVTLSVNGKIVGHAFGPEKPQSHAHDHEPVSLPTTADGVYVIRMAGGDKISFHHTGGTILQFSSYGGVLLNQHH